jgi:hypothetical protein
LAGGLLLGLFSSFLESLFGLTMPIVPGDLRELRYQLEEQAAHINWRAAANDHREPGVPVPAIEPAALAGREEDES